MVGEYWYSTDQIVVEGSAESQLHLHSAWIEGSYGGNVDHVRLEQSRWNVSIREQAEHDIVGCNGCPIMEL
jgi:hypothetical protein